MKIIIDADASPVKEEVIELAGVYGLDVLLVSSFSHFSNVEQADHVETIYVEHGADSADFKIVQKAKRGDIIITQDYGLASLLLPKGCHVLHHNAYEYSDENIDQLLQQRHISAMHRQSGERTKGPSAFTAADRRRFYEFFENFLLEL